MSGDGLLLLFLASTTSMLPPSFEINGLVAGIELLTSFGFGSLTTAFILVSIFSSIRDSFLLLLREVDKC